MAFFPIFLRNLLHIRNAATRWNIKWQCFIKKEDKADEKLSRRKISSYSFLNARMITFNQDQPTSGNRLKSMEFFFSQCNMKIFPEVNFIYKFLPNFLYLQFCIFLSFYFQNFTPTPLPFSFFSFAVREREISS